MTRIILLAAFLLACSKGKTQDPGPPCDKVVDKMLELTKQMIPGHDVSSLGDRKQMIAECEARKMPAQVRTCIVAAKSLDELAKCRTANPAANPPPPSGGPTPEPAPTRPLPTGSAAPGSGS